jgi:hypothetical protein
MAMIHHRESGGQQTALAQFTEMALVVLYFQRDNAIAGTPLPLATLALPGVIGALVAFNTLTAAAFVQA